MPHKTVADIFLEADANGWRRALIVTAIGLETKAVRAHIQELGHAVSKDGNFLELGHFISQGANWLVVVAETGAGTHEAQAVVQDALATYGPFELTIFVGIAGGRKTETVIGAVVASSEVYAAYGGKWADSDFSSRPDVLKVDSQLVNLAKKVERDEDWHDRIRPPLKGELPGDEVYPKPRPPRAFIAPIISVEAISADPKSALELQISKHYNDSHAVEMEGYGFLYAAVRNRIPGIVVRGISDERKDKDPALDAIYQPVAAVHAAAFAFEMIDLWGVTYERQPIVPKTAALSQTQPPTPPIDTTVPATVDQKPSSFVINFKGSPTEFPPERQVLILTALRELTGDATLEIVGTEAGSVRLVLKGAAGDLGKLSSLPLPEIEAKLNGSILGLMAEDEYRSALEAGQSLLTASTPLLNWPQKLPDETWIERPELGDLLSPLEGEDGTTTVLIGAPGSGKTALLARMAHELQARSVPFLAVKADLLDPSIATEDNLREHLAIKESPSDALLKLSRLRPVVLIIDQLDALAAYVDLRTGRLSVLLNLVRKLGLRRNIHIILSARAFEYEHDTRLKTIQAESVSLQLPAWAEVLKILEGHGIKAAGWPTDAQEVMRSPQALATFLLFLDRATVEPFHSYQGMLEKLWQDRILSLPNGGRVARLAGRIAEDMAERETLWIAASRYDDQVDDLALLLANGILTNPGTPGSVGFSHQTVFEFALARAFAQKEGRLSSYVLDRESSLFVRPKLWAALTYLRGVEEPTYLVELNAIWSYPNLRRHLRYLLLDFLGQQSSPIEGEAALLDRALQSQDRRVALQAIIGSPGWFERYRRSEIAKAMIAPTESNVAVGILIRAWPTSAENVIDLLKRIWLPNKDYDGLAWSVLDEAPVWTDAHLEAATTILSRTPIAPYAFDHTISTLGADQPSMAIQLARALLNARLDAAKLEADRRAELPKPKTDGDYLSDYHNNSPRVPIVRIVEQSDGWDGLLAVAEQDPERFLLVLWPWFEKLLAILKSYEEDDSDLGFRLQHALDFRFEEEHSLGLGEYAILGALRNAAEGFAKKDPKRFLEWLHEHESEDTVPSQRLFAHTLAAFPETYSTVALQFLLSDKRRLYLGSMEDLEGTTKTLVRAAAPHWTDEQLMRFVDEVKNYSPKPAEWRKTAEQRRNFQRYLGRLKFRLIEALPQERLPQSVVAFVEEERRRFGDPSSGAVFTGPTFIGSPMSSEELGRAKDDDVINAFRQLPDATGWDNPKDWMKGGNVQLARAFADFSKTDPDRAATIIRKMSPDIGTRAAGYAINAMAEVASPKLVLDLIVDLEGRGFFGEEYRGSVSRAVEHLIRRDVKIDDDIVGIVSRWLSDGKGGDNSQEDDAESVHEDDENSLEDVASQTQSEERQDSILWGMGGISVLPHGNFPALEVLTRIYLQRRDYDGLLKILNEHLDRPEQEKVWASLLRLFTYIRPQQPASFEAFLTSLFEQYPGFSRTREAAIFLAHMHWVVPDFVRSVLNVWKESEAPLVQQAYGELTTLVWLSQPNLEWANPMIEAILNQESGSARVGAAYASVHVWAETERKDRASKLLEQIIPTADDAAWSAVVDLFRLVEDIGPDAEWVRLLEAIAERIPAKASFTSTFVVDRLQSLLPHQAPLVAKIAKALTTRWRQELGDIRTGTAATAPELVDVAITLHRLGPETRDAGIEIFEDLLDTNAYGASETLAQIDNRFRRTPPSVRRRLPRKQRRATTRARKAS